jgi:RNA polymerase sigma-70 factor, ECF subfamily
MDPVSFVDALAAARAGDDRSFTILWRAVNPRLLRFLAGMGAREDLEDVASQTWLEVVRGLDGFDGDQRGFRAWVFTIARHRLFDGRRDQARRPAAGTEEHPTPAMPEADPAVLVEALWSTEEAIRIIALLAPDQAEVVLLRTLSGLGNQEIAEVVGKTEGAVRVLAHRGLRRLAQLLATSAAGEDPAAAGAPAAASAGLTLDAEQRR